EHSSADATSPDAADPDGAREATTSEVGDSVAIDSAAKDAADAADAADVIDSADSGADADADTDKPPPTDCGTYKGTTIVKISPGGGAPVFCIDKTEVTKAQYDDFIDAMGTRPPTATDQPDFCHWNESWGSKNTDHSKDQFPVTRVNWCQARKYCEWAGK